MLSLLHNDVGCLWLWRRGGIDMLHGRLIPIQQVELLSPCGWISSRHVRLSRITCAVYHIDSLRFA